ncbi:DUF262 domain-containing protein [Streptomyces nigra]|uniref:DUF262 domain-containing protein n=1 Tax=Streptomyces nigra TaxID=1827580 RepID=UPI0037FB6DB8
MDRRLSAPYADVIHTSQKGSAMTSESEREIEESPEELDGEEKTLDEKKSARERWEQGQRDLVTQVIDYTLGTLADLVADSFIDLQPEYQRRDRWDLTRKSRLIESFLLNIPIPPIFLNEDEYGQYSIIDGKQRIGAVIEFLQDGYPLKGLDVFYEANGKMFSQLDITLQRVLRTRASLRATILLHVSDPSLKYDVFDRLNTGGVSLNAQEVRNNAYRGPYNSLVMEISEDPRFHRALQINKSSAIWREMRDAELVLRYFTFREDWRSYSGSISSALNENMRQNVNLEGPALERLRAEFFETLEKAVAAFGEVLFRRWQPIKGVARKQLLVAIYDAQMLAVRDFSLAAIKEGAAEIEAGMKELFSDARFASTVDAATNTTASFHIRVEMVRELLARVVG